MMFYERGSWPSTVDFQTMAYMFGGGIFIGGGYKGDN